MFWQLFNTCTGFGQGCCSNLSKTNSWFGIQYILCAKIKMNALIQQQSKSDFTILLDTNHNFSPSIYIQKPADESIIRWKVV